MSNMRWATIPKEVSAEEFLCLGERFFHLKQYLQSTHQAKSIHFHSWDKQSIRGARVTGPHVLARKKKTLSINSQVETDFTTLCNRCSLIQIAATRHYHTGGTPRM
jgi:hypothetical protein